MAIETIVWKNGYARLIDQTKLPAKLTYINCKNLNTLIGAIKRLSVRGAPALGVAAAFGVLLGIKNIKGGTRKNFNRVFEITCKKVAASRPTAVNLFRALDAMRTIVNDNPTASVQVIKKKLHQEAMRIFKEDKIVCRTMGNHGSKLIRSGQTAMTICNAGALATADFGTALGVFYQAKKAKKKLKVIACETRPLLQGARLTAWELCHEKIDTTLICDNMAASMMKQGLIDVIFTGADRIAANGDAANKIGTYNLAVLARYHKIPFYIVAPQTTFDLTIKSGRNIPIEERHVNEVKQFRGVVTAPKNVKVYNPAFDVTDHKLITGIVTEVGIIKPPFSVNIKKKIKLKKNY